MTSSRNFPLIHFLLSLIFSLILIFLSTKNKVAFISQTVGFTLTPIRLPLFNLHSFFDHQLSSLHQIPHQERLIKDLKRQNAALSVLAQKATELEKENLSLRALIKTPPPSSKPLLPVKIIGINRYAFINQGEKNGVKSGQALVSENIFLGVVSSVSPNTAKVTLLNDPDVILSAVTSNSSTGLVKFNQNQFQLTQILQKDPLSADDRIYTQTKDLIPENLLVGTVSQILDNQSSVYQTAIYQPAINIFEIENAFIILD